MYFSNREKQILKRLLEETDGVSQKELQALLQISKRTLYREISSIEKSIKPLDLQLVKPRGSGYRLVGEETQLNELRKLVQKKERLPLDTIQRQSALAASLLFAEEEQTIEGLALDFEVSASTIHSDLQAVEASLEEYSLKLERRKARGIIITGGEYERRQILSNLIYNGVSEYSFFSYLSTVQPFTTYKHPTNFFLNLISPEAFYFAKKVILEKLKQLFVDVTDNQLQQVIISLALAIDRVQEGHQLQPKSDEPTISSGVYQLAEQILAEISRETQQHFPEEECRFFARQLEGVNYKKPQNIFLESFDVALSYQVRELIRLVSQQTTTDFRADDVLYYDLLTHLSAAFKRMDNLMSFANNPILPKVLDEYSRLATEIKSSLALLFPKQQFSEDELAYIVIHFAASLERNPSKKAVSTLVLCSSGIGTAKILESRLRKYLPEIDRIEVVKISQMSHLDYKEFDLILSTIYLPDFALPYKLISPLLLDDEIQKIKQEIQSKQFDVKANAPSLVARGAEDSFDQVYEVMRIGNDLLTQFDVKKIQTQNTLAQTLELVIAELEGVIVEDAKHVSELVMQRHELAPIGIPATNFALFHSANSFVKRSYFGVFDLNRSIPILGMDRKPMALTRVLLMLAPDPMTLAEERLMGLISASIIESDLNMEIYQQESKEVIYELLSSLFVNEIKEIKEEPPF